MRDGLRVGASHAIEYTIPTTLTVPNLLTESAVFRAGQPVLATGFMVGLLEWPCMEALSQFLDDDEACLGTMVRIRHSAPTPPGVRLKITAHCALVRDNYVEWEVEAADGDGEIAAAGRHGRRVVTRDRFLHRVHQKAARLGQLPTFAQPEAS